MTGQGRGHNIHATALVIGTTGLLITGPSGAGKSALALSLLTMAATSGRFARLVGDDRVWIRLVNGRIIARAPETIAGFLEMRGTGLVRLDFLDRAVMRLAVAPISDARLPENDETIALAPGISLPVLRFRYDDPTTAFATLVKEIRYIDGHSTGINVFANGL